eukprot:9477538-Pyramimonas_sp.AAC.1
MQQPSMPRATSRRAKWLCVRGYRRGRPSASLPSGGPPAPALPRQSARTARGLAGASLRSTRRQRALAA